MAGKNPPDLDFDAASATGFVSWYSKLPQDGNCLRVFDRKGYFTVHGPDVDAVARRFYKGTGAVQLGKGASQLATLSLNRSLFEQLLRTTLVEDANKVVELYEGHGSTWRVARRASPGNLAAFEDELYSGVDMVDAPLVIAVTSQVIEGALSVGVAYVDVNCRRLGATQFDDDEQLCALERILVQLGAKECVLPQETATNKQDTDKLEKLITECETLVTKKPRTHFNAKDIEPTIATLVKEGSAQQHADVLERPLACSALAAVLEFAEVTANAENHGKYALELYRPDSFMRLDMAARRALHIFPAKAETRGNTSVYGILNQTRTAMGKRLLRSWLKQPLTDVSLIEERHTLVQAFVDDAELRENIRDAHLRGISDLQRLARKLSARKISLQELCQLYMASNQLPALVDVLSAHTGDAADILRVRYTEELTRAHAEDVLVKFEELMEAAVDLDAVPDEYLIDASYDPQLQSIKEERDAAQNAVQSEASRIADDLGLELDKTIKLEWHRANNNAMRCMRITQKEEKALRSKLGAKYIVLETRKDGTKFTSKRMKEAANNLNDLTKAYSATQATLIDSVRDVAATYVQVWETVAELLAELDVIASFAHVASSSPTPYCRPCMLPADSGELELTQSRHACLELQEGVDVIPNDCVMKRGESWFQVITGPNMGGKSTFIRQVGVCVLMAQVGSFVPCESARISVRDCIFARVGAGDCQLKGVSTFMAEMLETAAILKGATERSLLIIDELGRGTSTYDGFGLAWALSEHIMQVIGAPTLFATHFHELTAIKGPIGVKNRHMKTHLDPASSKLTMLYQVVDGACDQSFGIHVAEFANFPPEVVENAKRKLAELEASSTGFRVTQGDPKRAATEDAPASDDDVKAQAAVVTFLRGFADLPMDTTDEAVLERQISSLREQLLGAAENNPKLQSIISSAV